MVMFQRQALLALLTSFSFLPQFTLGAGGAFSYDPQHEFGPHNWHNVDVPDNQCGGDYQSGINLPILNCTRYEDYIFRSGTCKAADMTYFLDPYQIKAEYDPNRCTPPQMIIPGLNRTFEALQFHFHTGTDHALGGTFYGATIHIVHKDLADSGDLAVVGLFIEPTNPEDVREFEDLILGWEGAANETTTYCEGGGGDGEGGPGVLAGVLGDAIEAFKLKAGGVGGSLGDVFNLIDLVPKDSSMYHYKGSLTTPPCSEIVIWNVVDIPVSVSVREYIRLSNLILDYVDPESCELASASAPSGFTGRPVMPVNNRKVERICPQFFSG